MKPGTPEYFWSRVRIGEPNDCWLFEKASVGRGYGQARYRGKRWRAHRLAYRLAIGEIPAGKHVCHTCDNPLCCNPSHLWLGTNSDNQRDRVRKSRQGGKTKLTAQDVAAMKAERQETGAATGYLAEKYGVTEARVVRILNGHSWSPIEPDAGAMTERKEPGRPLRYIAVGGECRRSILALLNTTSSGMTLREIRQTLEKAKPKFGYSTVYSAARSLYRDGLVNRYQANPYRRAPHVYFIEGGP